MNREQIICRLIIGRCSSEARSEGRFRTGLFFEKKELFMGQPAKRYSSQDVWNRHLCGPTIFDRIGKDFDKSGYDLHWLRDADLCL